MGAWSTSLDGSDAAADWFSTALSGNIDAALDDALRYSDTYAQIRAAAYLLTVLGRSSYIWPGDLDRLDSHVTKAIASLESMVQPDSEAHKELEELWGDYADELFGKIRAELDGLKAAHRRT